MRPTLPKRLLATIQQCGMILPGDRVAVAVSGGGDSVALLLLLAEIRESLGMTLAVAHFNHRLRAGEADEDEEFVRRLANRLGLACFVRGEDVGEESRRAGTNLEAEARERRYAFFQDLVFQGWATRVATGHTADDQAETVLARLARGSGLRGLGAIRPVLGFVVRPLLDVRRKELREYLTARDQPWREDATNLDPARTRTRIRRRWLPAWENEFGASSVRNLTQLAELARNDEALLDELVEFRFRCLSRREDGGLALKANDVLDPWPELKAADARHALAARLVRRAAREVRGHILGLTAGHVASVLDLARHGTSGSRIELPGGLTVERVLNRLVFTARSGAAEIAREGSSYAYSIDPWHDSETVVRIAEIGKRLLLKLIDWPPEGRETCREGFGVLDAERLEPPLLIRNRLPGDSYRPCGRGHEEKLKRLLLERRVSGKDRARWPVLTSAGRPVWSSGLPVAAEVAARADTQRALVIREEPDGPGGENSFYETAIPRCASNI